MHERRSYPSHGLVSGAGDVLSAAQSSVAANGEGFVPAQTAAAGVAHWASFSLALGNQGRPRTAYDANHAQGGACGTLTDTRPARFIQFK